MEDEEAPHYDIPRNDLVTIEHPGVIRNIDRAISSLGGHDRLEEFLSSKGSEKNLFFYSRPEDSFRPPIAARQVSASNLVLRVTVPKRTGRKRKRGSNHDFKYDPDTPSVGALNVTTKTLLRSLQDNADNYDVEVVGETRKNCRFLGLPDFQWSSGTNEVAKRMKHAFPPMEKPLAPGSFHLLPNVFPDINTPTRLRDFNLDITRKGHHPHISMSPPPFMLLEDTPYSYHYSQTQVTRTVMDSFGKPQTENSTTLPKTHIRTLDFRATEVPQGPNPSLPPEHAFDEYGRDLLLEMRRIFDRHPIYTRRSLMNLLPESARWYMRYALQYCAYQFKSGPWKDTYIKFGVDPRSSPYFSKYQAVAIRFVGVKNIAEVRKKARIQGGHSHSHIFDGRRVCLDGSTWIMSDITDPLLKEIIDNAAPRETCDIGDDGWFQNCTMAKLRIILKDKIGLLAAGVTPDDGEYEGIASLPESIPIDKLSMVYPTSEQAHPRIFDLFLAVRHWLKEGRWRDKKLSAEGKASDQAGLVKEDGDEGHDSSDDEDSGLSADEDQRIPIE